MQETQKIILILVIIAFAYAAESQFDRKVEFKVVNDKELQKIFTKNNNQIPNFLTPYGIIPWGKMIQGQLQNANPPDACSKLQYDQYLNQLQKPFLLVQMDSQNNCSIEEKIYHAQNHGAQLVILISKSKDDGFSQLKNYEKLQMISIPVVQVGNDIGETLTLFTTDYPDKRPILAASFPVQETTQNFLKMYVDINSQQSLKLLRLVGQYNQEHKFKYTIQINHYIHESILDDIEEDDTSEEAKQQRKDIQKEQELYCYGEGKYCDKDNPTSILEIIRQTCLYANSSQNYLEYIDLIERQYYHYIIVQANNTYNDLDFQPFNFTSVSRVIMEKLKINIDEINNCIQNSFIDAKDAQGNSLPNYKLDNYFLKNHLSQFESIKNHSQLPFVVLNNKEIPFRTQEYYNDVIKQLCEADNDAASDICNNQYQTKKNNSNKGLNIGQVILVVICSLFGSLVLCCIFAQIYSRYQKRRYSAELERVDSLVQSYIELNNDKENQTNT
ncbi:hypothetical protein ABPG72_012984 [Tetrahymena utriculariae]